jgi:vacuolar protein-sorting-associated protein 4
MGDFLQKGIALVQQATEKDHQKEYQEAFRLYSSALDHFMAALKCIVS